MRRRVLFVSLALAFLAGAACGAMVAMFAMSGHVGVAQPPKRQDDRKSEVPNATIVRIGNPSSDTEIAGLSVGNTIEYARKLWGPEAERVGENGVPSGYTWYLRKNVVLSIETDSLNTVRYVSLSNSDPKLGVVTAGKIVLGRDTLLDLERKGGGGCEVRKSVWGTELIYVIDAVYRTGPEGSLKLSYSFDLTASDRASPPVGYEAWLDRIGTALDKKNNTEVKRLLDKHTVYRVELRPYDDEEQ